MKSQLSQMHSKLVDTQSILASRDHELDLLQGDYDRLLRQQQQSSEGALERETRWKSRSLVCFLFLFFRFPGALKIFFYMKSVKIFEPNCNCIFVQCSLAVARRQQSDLSVFVSSCQLPTSLPHAVKASYCSFFNCWTSNRRAVNCVFCCV